MEKKKLASNLSEHDRLVGKVASAICRVVFDRAPAESHCAVLTPAITYKVKHRLDQIDDLQETPIEDLYKVTKQLHNDIQNIIEMYEIQITNDAQMGDLVEHAALKVLEEHLSKNSL